MDGVERDKEEIGGGIIFEKAYSFLYYALFFSFRYRFMPKAFLQIPMHRQDWSYGQSIIRCEICILSLPAALLRVLHLC